MTRLLNTVMLSMLMMTACVHTPEQKIESAPVTAARPRPPGSAADVLETTERFVASVEKRQFDQTLVLLAAPLRARYSPERLSADFAADSLAAERVQRIKLSLVEPFVVTGDAAELPLPGAHSFKLVHERDGWKVAALE